MYRNGKRFCLEESVRSLDDPSFLFSYLPPFEVSDRENETFLGRRKRTISQAERSRDQRREVCTYAGRSLDNGSKQMPFLVSLPLTSHHAAYNTLPNVCSRPPPPPPPPHSPFLHYEMHHVVFHESIFLTKMFPTGIYADGQTTAYG